LEGALCLQEFFLANHGHEVAVIGKISGFWGLAVPASSLFRQVLTYMTMWNTARRIVTNNSAHYET